MDAPSAYVTMKAFGTARPSLVLVAGSVITLPLKTMMVLLPPSRFVA